jgi:hypothetical protein
MALQDGEEQDQSTGSSAAPEELSFREEQHRRLEELREEERTVGLAANGRQSPFDLSELLCVKGALGAHGGLEPRAWADGHVCIITGKHTLARLHSTPEQVQEREGRLTAAIRTVLECIGENPDREGLKKTPERYAKALLWMTHGYEEQMKGNRKRGLLRLHNCPR